MAANEEQNVENSADVVVDGRFRTTRVDEVPSSVPDAAAESLSFEVNAGFPIMVLLLGTFEVFSDKTFFLSCDFSGKCKLYQNRRLISRLATVRFETKAHI